MNDTANLLKLLQQFGGDTDMADREIEAVINTSLEFGLKSTIMDDFRLLVQISFRDEPSDRSFFRIGKMSFPHDLPSRSPTASPRGKPLCYLNRLEETRLRGKKKTRKSGG